MIDPQTENLRTVNEARRLPWMKGRFGNAVSLCTLMRWINRGIDGVTLDAIKIGGTLFTSDEATLRFVDELNQDSQDSRNPARLSRELAKADKALDEAGI